MQLICTSENSEFLSSPPKLLLSLFFCQRASCDREHHTEEYGPETATFIQCHKYSLHSHPEDGAILKSQVITQVF